MQDFLLHLSLQNFELKSCGSVCHPSLALMNALGLALCWVFLGTQWGPGQTLSLLCGALIPVRGGGALILR